jgi:hypothetical protein
MPTVAEILADDTARLDVRYWENFAGFKIRHALRRLGGPDGIGDLVEALVGHQPRLREQYYPFKVTYEGRVVLKNAKATSDVSKFKIVEPGNIVFSRINCFRGAIAVVRPEQVGGVCTGETHVFKVRTGVDVDPAFIRLVLRHPYYQDLIMSQSTGASIERMRFSDQALLELRVPDVPRLEQTRLIKAVEEVERRAMLSGAAVKRLRVERNHELLLALGAMPIA